MLNQEIAAVFYRLAWLTSQAGEPVFKTAAYRKAARAIVAEPRPLADLRREGALRQVPGVGDKIEVKIGEILDTDRLRTLDRLRAAAPAGRRPRIAVVGSLNMDLVAWAPRRPERGESLAGTRFATYLGGKGFNQAVAAARLGADVTMVGRVGQDDFGAAFLAGLKRAGVDARHVGRDANRCTGVGLPLVEPDGANSIVVVLGANLALVAENVDAAIEAIATADVLMLQLEVPQETSLHAARIARAAGATVLLNPAPAQPILPDLLRASDWLTPNEVEARMLTGAGASSPAASARSLLDRGARRVLVTLGAAGCLHVSAQEEIACPAYPVQAVDTTAAGDAFCAGLAVALAEGRDAAAAMRFANAAGALAVTIAGAGPSLPERAAVDALAVT